VGAGGRVTVEKGDETTVIDRIPGKEWNLLGSAPPVALLDLACLQGFPRLEGSSEHLKIVVSPVRVRVSHAIDCYSAVVVRRRIQAGYGR
jgi:hypothetical protein